MAPSGGDVRVVVTQIWKLADPELVCTKICQNKKFLGKSRWIIFRLLQFRPVTLLYSLNHH